MGRGLLEKPRFQNINVTCTKPVLLNPINCALGCCARDPGCRAQGSFLVVGWHFWRPGLNYLKGAWKLFLGQVQGKGVKSTMASGPHRVQTPLVGRVLGGEEWTSEEKGKKVKLNLRRHSWLARRWKFLFACVVGLPLTCIFRKGHIFFWLGCILRMCQLWINRACANNCP